MSTRAITYLISAAVGVVIIAIFVTIRISRWQNHSSPTPSVSSTATEQPRLSQTRLDVPANIEVPDATSIVDSNVAKPSAVRPEEPTSDSKLRVFQIEIKNDKFTPDTVIIRAKDEADITFTAVDKTYDFIQPDNGYEGTVPKGATKVLAGRFYAPGKYIIYCPSCGGPDKGPIGYIIVVPQSRVPSATTTL